MYEVVVLKEGYSIVEDQGKQKACGTITLLKGPRNIIVDTGNPWDKQLILDGLSEAGMDADSIKYVVCTSAKTGKVGNLNVFSNAICIVSGELSHKDHYLYHGFQEGIPYEIDDDVEVISTPGHTGSDVSVIVRNTSQGTVAVTGDLFECLEDLEDYTLWQENSENPEIQQQNRLGMLRIADWIVPGHGPMFKVPQCYKEQLKMVMFEHIQHSVSKGEDKIDGASSSYTETSYIVIEESND